MMFVNPSTSLMVDPERRFFSPPKKTRLGATEWVNPCEFPSENDIDNYS
jgi:hypothetical protein